MGNILGLKRYGQTSSTGYDVIDDLSLSYVGNRLKKVADRSGTSTFNNGFEFKDGIDLSTEYEYDENGNLTKDLNKNITAIQYNCLNLPSRVMFANGNSISYLYDAAGRKLRTVHVLEGDSVTTDYCGNVVYENGVPQILLTEVGYVSLTDGKYHYYLKDHQGNNRVVVDEEGTVEEVNDYYAFGGLMSTSSRQSVQPYKYNGKELDRKGGLDWYDYGARYYDAALGRWHVVDPMAEEYYSISPYEYCNNSPIIYIDPTGMLYTGYTVDRNGYILKINNEGGDNYDVLYNKEKYSSETKGDYDKTGNKTGIQISKGILLGTDARSMSSKITKGVLYTQDGQLTGKTVLNHAYEVKNDQESVSIMNFLDKNTDVEWSNTLMENKQGGNVNLISTSHEAKRISFGSYQINKYIRSGYQVLRSDHIHPGEGRVASGDTGDIGNAKNILQHSPKAIFRILNKGIYYNYTNEIYRK